jgi:hypothetical protein
MQQMHAWSCTHARRPLCAVRQIGSADQPGSADCSQLRRGQGQGAHGVSPAAAWWGGRRQAASNLCPCARKALAFSMSTNTALAAAVTSLMGSDQLAPVPAVADCASFLLQLRRSFEQKHVGGSQFHKLKLELAQLWAPAPAQAYVVVGAVLGVLGSAARHAGNGGCGSDANDVDDPALLKKRASGNSAVHNTATPPPPVAQRYQQAAATPPTVIAADTAAAVAAVASTGPKGPGPTGGSARQRRAQRLKHARASSQERGRRRQIAEVPRSDAAAATPLALILLESLPPLPCCSPAAAAAATATTDVVDAATVARVRGEQLLCAIFRGELPLLRPRVVLRLVDTFRLAETGAAPGPTAGSSSCSSSSSSASASSSSSGGGGNRGQRTTRWRRPMERGTLMQWPSSLWAASAADDGAAAPAAAAAAGAAGAGAAVSAGPAGCRPPEDVSTLAQGYLARLWRCGSLSDGHLMEAPCC